MSGNSFINFGKADVPQGESMQKGHHGDDGWIEISDWSWEVESDHSVTKGTGAAVGKPKPGSLSITHYFDTSSPAILAKIVAGKHFPTITIEMLKSTGAVDGPQAYFQVKVSDAYVTKVATKGAEDGSLNQDVEFVFKEIFIGYKPQKNDGKLDTTTSFEWSVKDMKTSTAISGKLA
ncbi:Hcp family type VI secretion system effector [Roseateles amylovorans]|uniref:Type VI secretion system tube protein Hcp n=1 Tax=Roseateles amylovorans TaxID=2978473 RepID=A0ABY6AUA6_9BURK|nr:type VI secretion system tube protein Hcp [Roseateles amylovorans]UXH76155.1 type VI secretion system tube protein Hcp [Roseateles amylovorans]